MSDNNRSFGQGAQGEPDAPKANKIRFAQRLRYNFDNSIASSKSFMAFMGLAVVVVAVLITALRYNTEGADAEGANFFDRFWSTIAILFLGAGKPDANWGQRVLAIVFWASSLIFTATVIGFISSKILGIVTMMKKGKSAVLDGGHTLILGWSNRIFPILKELAIANQNVRKAKVVVFSNIDRETMEDEIASRAGELGKLKVITRFGDATNPADLQRANVSAAKSIIVLDSDSSGDATVVSTVLALKAVNASSVNKIIAEVDDANTAEALQTATEGRVIPVRSHDVIARVTAQASRQPGLAAVTLDLLDFDGDEIYFNQVPALAGKTYGDALLAFNTASVIGLVDEKGSVKVNPKHSTKLTAESKVIAIAEDDDKVVYTGVREDIAKKKFTAPRAPVRKAEHLLVIGWSEMGQSVIAEVAQFLPKGSTVHIVANQKFVAADKLANLKFGANVKVSFAAVSGDIDELIAAASAKKYNEIIILGYRNAISESEADAQTMLTMLQMNQLFDAKGNGVEPTRLVAEILDSRKAELARVAAVDDLVVSDNLAALLIAQVSENPKLAPVFEDLFDADGASINVNPIEEYAPLGKEIEYAELVGIAHARGESAIGYRVLAASRDSSSSGVVLNPAKTQKFTPKAGDSLVVVGDLS